MEIEFDADKDATNVAKHQISLARAAELVIVAVERDLRFDYGETRFRAWGFIGDLPYCLAFTFREARYRAISLRRVHKKEWARHVE